MKTAPLLPMIAAQTRAEFLKLWRLPAFSVTSIALPAVFYLFIGLQQGRYSSVNIHTYILASLAAYAAVNVSLFSFGISVAVERGERMDALMRATPLRPIAYLIGKVATAIAFAFVALIALYVVAYILGRVLLPIDQYANLTARLLIGMIPFIAMGFSVGYLFGPRAALPVINLIYLPMAFASGIFFPVQVLPDFIQKIAPYLPMYHYGRLAWNAVGVSEDNLFQSVLWLAGYLVLFTALTTWAAQREERRRFS